MLILDRRGLDRPGFEHHNEIERAAHRHDALTDEAEKAWKAEDWRRAVKWHVLRFVDDLEGLRERRWLLREAFRYLRQTLNEGAANMRLSIACGSLEHNRDALLRFWLKHWSADGSQPGDQELDGYPDNEWRHFHVHWPGHCAYSADGWPKGNLRSARAPLKQAAE